MKWTMCGWASILMILISVKNDVDPSSFGQFIVFLAKIAPVAKFWTSSTTEYGPHPRILIRVCGVTMKELSEDLLN